MPYRERGNSLGINASARTIRRAMGKEGFHRFVALKKPFLTEKSMENQYKFTFKFLDWKSKDWEFAIWTDECAFNVGGVPGRVYVTRRAREEYDNNCLIPRFAKRTCVMVWAFFIAGKTGPLVIWDPSTMGKTVKAQSYCEFVVGPHLHPFWQELCQSNDAYIYVMQDNASPHKAFYTRDYMEKLYGNMADYLFPWPANSLDMNPIDNIWRILKNRVYGRLPKPNTTTQLNLAILEEWDALDEAEILGILL
jgi:hypothetical protein